MSEKDETIDTPKRKGARGPLCSYNPGLHNIIAEIAAEAGFTDQEIASKLGVSRATLAIWKKDFPEFAKILRNRKKYADDKVVRSLYERAQGYTDENNVELFHYKGEVIQVKVPKHYPPDPTSMIFWLKNRQPEQWRDRHDINITGNIDYKEQRKKTTKLFNKIDSPEKEKE